MNDFHIVKKDEPIGYPLGGLGSLHPALGWAFFQGCPAAECHVDQGIWKRCLYPDPAWLRKRMAELDSDTPARAEFVASMAESRAAVTAVNERRWKQGWEPSQEDLDKERPGVLEDLPTILNRLRQFVEAYEKEFANATDWTPVPGEALGHRTPYVRLYLG